MCGINSIEKICPMCGEEYSGEGAISMKDKKTEICEICGIGEAIEMWINWEEEDEYETLDESN